MAGFAEVHEDQSAGLVHRIRREADAGRASIGAVGNVLAAAVDTEAPPVERATDALALDHPAVADVRPEVGAMGIGDDGNARVGPEHDELAAEPAEWHHLAGRRASRIRRRDTNRSDTG